MRYKTTLLFLAFSFLFIINGVSASGADGSVNKVKIKAVAHLNSSVTSGKYSPEKLTMIAEKKGIDAVFITENFYPRVEYGALPFRGILKKVKKFNSLLEYGFQKYRDRIDNLDRKVKDVDVFTSAEVVPFYFWTGDPYKEGLTLNDWDVQFLVLGLTPSEYRDMPTLATGKFSKFDFISLLKLWPLFLLILGIVLSKVRIYRFYINNAVPWILIMVGAFYALHLYPFKHVIYDQYHGRVLPGPYQALIDYVNDKGGMVFWSAPEAQLYRRYGPILFASPKATEHMLSTRDYTGFCVFYEGYREIGGAGGTWDVLLNEYCWGKRKKPVWAIGESAFHDEKSSGAKEMDEVQTVFFVEERSKKAIMDALRNGSMYVVRKGNSKDKNKDFLIEMNDFFISSPGGKKAFMGEEMISKGPVTLNFSVDWETTKQKQLKAEIIRNGKVIKKMEIKAPGEIKYIDDYYSPGEKAYYRLDIRGEYPVMLFTNPIFVTFSQNEEQ